MRWLDWFFTLDLIDLFGCYLILAICVSTGLRVRTYRAIIGLVFSSPGRWPKLLELVKKHRSIFLGWPMLLATGLALMLMDGSGAASNDFRLGQPSKDRRCGSAENARGRQLDRNWRNVANVATNWDATGIWPLVMAHVGLRFAESRLNRTRNRQRPTRLGDLGPGACFSVHIGSLHNNPLGMVVRPIFLDPVQPRGGYEKWCVNYQDVA